MRTKTLVVTALCGLVSSAAVMAQSVYSLNAVGYVNTVIPTGFSIIANPLNAATNTLSSLLAGAPEGTMVYKYSGANFDSATFSQNDAGVLTWDNDLTLVPGEGAWINNPSAPFTNTFVGEVVTGTNTIAVPVGYSLKGSIVPQAGVLNTDLGYPAQEGDAIYLYDNSIKNFVVSNYGQDDAGNLVWDNIPTIKVGQGFWIYTTTAKSWTRVFNLNN